MNLAYVCTNYNNSTETITAIDSLRANTRHAYRCFVVDNRSRDDQVELLRRYAENRPEVDLILNDVNLGYFRGLNVGLARLQTEAPDFLHAVVGNNDLRFPADFADAVERQLNRFTTHPVVSPSIVTMDGEHQNPHVIDGISNLRERVYDLYHASYPLALTIKWLVKHSRGAMRRGDEDRHDEGREIVQGHGSCYLFGPRFFAEFGQLWAPTFLFGEEFFLSKQLADKGCKVYYEPSIRLEHVSHASVSKIPGRKHWQLSRDAHRVYRQFNPIPPKP